MGFSQRDKPTKSQASMSSFTGDLKDDAKNVGELVAGTGRVIGKTVANTVRGTARKLIHDGRNSDLKASMRGHSQFRDRTRSDD